MRYLKIISVLLGVFLFFGCNNDKKIEEIANKYVVENIVPLFPNAQLTYMCSVRPADGVVMKIKDVVKHHEIITNHNMFLLDRKEIQIRSLEYAHSEKEEKEKMKMYLLENSIIQNSIKALEKANSEEGFYIVYTAIKYGEDKCQSFDIIISKDLKVLNTPIDTMSINNIISETYKTNN